MWPAEYAYEQLTKHEELIRSAIGSNEDTTRLRAIDTMMFDVLGWDKVQVETEKYCRAEGFADYVFAVGGDAALILEAKKSGVTFLLPDRAYPSSPVGLPLLAKECPNAEVALRQALGYAAGEGARYIAISNGHQWIVTLTYVQNQSIADRSIFVFESLKVLKESKFRLFFDCLGPQAIQANLPADKLLESRKAPAPAKLSASIINYPHAATRNQIVNEISMVTETIWDEVRNDEPDAEFLEACYVEPNAKKKMLDQSRELIAKRLSLDEKVRSDSVSLGDVEQLVVHKSAEKPIVILGRVGHGKSTYLRYLRQVKAKSELGKYIQLDIDFIHRPDSSEAVGRFIYEQVESQLRERYEIDITADNQVRGVLHIELQRFKDSPEGKLYDEGSNEFKKAELKFIKEIQSDAHRYLTAVFRHLRKGREYSVAVFLDNLDRRVDPIQEEAFLRASAMAGDWEALVFICLRPGTFYRSKFFGVLDSVVPTVVTVVSPRTDTLVTRRLNYARQIALGLCDSSRAKQGAPFSKQISLYLPSVADFLAACSNSFARNKELCDLFTAVSNGNARDLLRHVLLALTSSHLDTDKIIASGPGYLMPVHEALRALLFCDTMYYDPTKSFFVNLFDVERADPMEHFTRLLSLDHLSRVSPAHPAYGYCRVEDLFRYLGQLGYSEEHSKATIGFLFEKGCCESKVPSEDWGNEIQQLRVTARGNYMISRLVRTFNYLDAIIVDTPVLDAEVRKSISDVMSINQRLERCEIFLGYLDNCSSALHDANASEFWRSACQAVRSEIKKIRQSLG